MAWWDNLWLNEGFASWMAGKASARFNPRWGTPLRDALWKDQALSEDARRTTHPIQTPVENDTRAMDVFDAITYAKGAAVLRMLEGYLGEDGARIAFPIRPPPTSGTTCREHRDKTSASWSRAGPSSPDTRS